MLAKPFDLQVLSAKVQAILRELGITDRDTVSAIYAYIVEEPVTYLKYYLGYLEICRLKESAMALSPELTDYDFHTWFLETGPAPFSILRESLDSPVP